MRIALILLIALLLVYAMIAYAKFSFNKSVSAEIAQLLAKTRTGSEDTISAQMIEGLPISIRSWLTSSGMVGKETIRSVHLEQEALMQMKPGQKNWNKANAKQYFTTDPPAFNWFVNLSMFRILPVAGRDKFEDGKGEMTIRLLSLIPVVNTKNNQKTDEGTLQRYLAEIVWFPSAALSPYITWEPIDDFSAKATMNYMGTEGSGTFHFDKDGRFLKFETMRYAESDENSERKLWTVTATKTGVRNGISIPVEANLKWKLEEGDWTWLKLKITHIEYNMSSPFAD